MISSYIILYELLNILIKVYNRMIMDTLAVKSYCLCREFFMTEYFPHNWMRLFIIGHTSGKGS